MGGIVFSFEQISINYSHSIQNTSFSYSNSAHMSDATTGGRPYFRNLYNRSRVDSLDDSVGVSDYAISSRKSVSSSRTAPLRDMSARASLLRDVPEYTSRDSSRSVSCDFQESLHRREMLPLASLSKPRTAFVFPKGGRQKIKVESGIPMHLRKRVRLSMQCRETLRIPAGPSQRPNNWPGMHTQRLSPAPRDWSGHGIVIRKKKHAPRTKLETNRADYRKRARVQKLSQHIQTERLPCSRTGHRGCLVSKSNQHTSCTNSGDCLDKFELTSRDSLRETLRMANKNFERSREVCERKRGRFADETPEQCCQRLVGVHTYIRYLRRAPKRFRA